MALESKNKKKIRAEQTTIKKRILKKQKIAHCEYCGNKTKEILQIHHIEPIAMGGNNDLDNLNKKMNFIRVKYLGYKWKIKRLKIAKFIQLYKMKLKIKKNTINFLIYSVSNFL